MNSKDRGLAKAVITSDDIAEAAMHYERFLRALGANLNDCNLQETPKRVAKMWAEFLTPKDFKFTTFEGEGYDEMIICGPVPFYSMCAHHNLPFFGTAYVGYIPNGNNKIVGISKLARTVQWFAAGFQNQERITKQVADELQTQLQPQGVAVVLTARHMCMELRGAKTHNCNTTTSTMLGAFKDDLNARNEFLNLIKK
jgi:GTP cyclohydrolase IA